MQADGREVEHGLDAGRHNLVEHALRDPRRDGDDGHVDPLLPHDLRELAHVVDSDLGAADFAPDLLAVVVEERDDFEVRLAEAVVVGERGAEVARADDAYAVRAVEPEYLRQASATRWTSSAAT